MWSIIRNLAPLIGFSYMDECGRIQLPYACKEKYRSRYLALGANTYFDRGERKLVIRPFEKLELEVERIASARRSPFLKRRAMRAVCPSNTRTRIGENCGVYALPSQKNHIKIGPGEDAVFETEIQGDITTLYRVL